MGNIPTVYAPLFEHFKPRSEWRHEDGYDTLLVYLPGFKNIEVTTEDLNIVRVHGGRFTDEGNWSEVNEDYRVPETCEMSGIRSRFDGGILTITMPKRKIANTPPPPPPPTTTTATQVPPITADEQTFKRTKQEEPLPKPKEELKENKPVDKPQSTDNSTNLPPQPIIMPTFPDEPDKQALLKPQINPLEDNTLTLPPPTSSYSTPSKQEPTKTTLEAKDQENGEFAFGSLPANVPKNDKHNAVEKPNNVADEKTWLDAGKGMHALLEEMNKNFKDGMGEKNDGRGGFQGDDKMEENKKVVASSGVMNDEDRKKLLVNVGVGVLVIVALLSYTTGLIGKGNCN